MSKNPLFSVLVANYNNSKYLQEAINSVKRQTYKNWEIIIVDDCSTDNPEKLYENLEKDQRIRILKNISNKKTAFTFKRALENSSGEICGFLGPDDALEDTAIEKAVKCHLCLPDYAIVYTLNYLCDEKLRVKELFRWGGVLPNDESQLTVSAGKKITSFATFKKSFYDLTDGINMKFNRGFDQDFYYKMEEVGKVFCIEEPLYYYRQHKNNISLNENNIKAWYWLYIANKDAYNRRKKNTLSIKNITYGELQRTYLHVCLLKIDQKIRNSNYRNIFFYYCQIIRLCVWDRDMEILKKHVFFLKRAVKKIIPK